MNRKILIAIVLIFFLGIAGYFVYQNRPKPPVTSKFVQNVRQEKDEPVSTDTAQLDTRLESEKPVLKDKKVEIVEPGNYVELKNPKHIYQTFNNCGPATLSMILSWYGVDVSQAELGQKMRPYQNPQGDNDDKTIFTHEFVDWAEKYELQALGRVNGDIELLKKFTSNNIPVVVKTWLNPNDDIGHFRIVRGFDEAKQVIIQDDSYQGPNKKISYFDFLSMWQPFNYDYIIVYTPEMQAKVKAIIGAEMDEAVSWENALKRAEKEKSLDSDNPYPDFNVSTAAFHLGDFKRSVSAFEQVEFKLPKRMLWYQIEPIRAYQELEDFTRVFQITENILNNGNRAFPELYMIRGEIYLLQGNKDKASQEFELALKYNPNFSEAKQALLDF
jgi:tetratricopeptide (TPR) repeat protein